MTVATEGPWRAGVVVAELHCQFEAESWLTDSVPSDAQPVTSHMQLTVELRQVVSGRLPWALLAADYAPSDSERVNFEVGQTGELSSGNAAHCQGPLKRPLVAGLPTEFALATLDGLVRRKLALPPGCLRIVGAGYDEVESSAVIFERAAGFLVEIVRLCIDADSVSEKQLSEILSGWN